MRVALIVLALALAAGTARAYPQLQFTTGATRCGECHVTPDGGGLLTDYGRDEAGDTLSGRGDGRLLHGAWTPPDWLQLGGDLRGALGGKQLDGEAAELLAFPMQADLYGRVAVGPVSINLTVGGNGAARGRNADAPITSYLVSREHFVAFHQEDAPWSVRAGRFYPTLGLRTHDHTAYVRRHLDMYLLEEPYALEGEYTRGRWQAFGSAFIGNPVPELAAGDRASGAAASLERLLDDGAVAGHARAAFGPEDRRYLVGAVGKRWLAGPQLLVLAEVDVQRQRLATGFVRYQLVGYLGVTRPFLPGYLIGAALQRYAPDVTFGGTTRNALELNLQAFPWAHTELHLLTRAEATGGDTTHPNLLALLQLHYYL
ncbi:MAG: hypothetical protein IPH44_36190 [Myxococcales bacterium]|nr:hypothetical protein [Myxococcales bacterium]MBK7191231.1 hypothetical protein [Myxococcales bacterium]MBP6842605.1 hypothetical protein [Kofleriaceae bacterium]